MVNILIGGYSSNLGGVERFIINLLRALPKDKFSIDLLIFSEVIPAEKLIREHSHKLIMSQSRRSAPHGYNKRLRQILKDGNYDVVWSNQCSLSDMSLLLEAYKIGIPVRILYAHTSGKMGNLLTTCLHKINKSKLKYANEKWACSNEAWDFFFSDSQDSSTKAVFPNAIFPSDFAYREDLARNFRQKLNIEDKYVIGSVGRLREEKNHAFIINLMPDLIKQLPDLVYVVIGQGRLMTQLKDLVNDLSLEEHVILTGFVDNVDAYLNAFDLFLMPSKYEGLPYVLIEAQMNGLPILASDTITTEAAISDSIEYLPLIESLWKEKIIDYARNKKSNRSGENLNFDQSPVNMLNTGKLFENRILDAIQSNEA